MVNWEIEPHESATEHRHNVMVISSKMPVPQPKFRIRIGEHVETLLTMPERIGNMAPAWLEGKSDDESVAELTNIIQGICEKVKRTKIPRTQIVPWWSESLTVERKKVHAARVRFQRCTENHELRKTYEVTYQKL